MPFWIIEVKVSCSIICSTPNWTHADTVIY